MPKLSLRKASLVLPLTRRGPPGGPPKVGPVGEQIVPGIDIWNADFREIVPSVVKDVAHVITDPPYEQRSHNATGRIRRTDGKAPPKALSFEGIDYLRSDVIERAKLACKGWLLAFCTTEGVAAWRDEIERKGLKYKTPMIWVKPDAMPKFNGQGPAHGHECIVSAWCGSGYSRWNGGGKRGVFFHLVNPPTRDGRHETEKPLSLMCELISLFTNPGDLVCDPFMGSGTTGLACMKLGRRFIGCEIDPAYYAVAKDRLNKAAQQFDMFVVVDKLRQAEMEL